MADKVCSFTGHRSIKASHREKISALLKKAIAYAYSEGCRVFMSGGAVGFDTLAAREVILFRMMHRDVKLHLILPCIDQDLKWSEADRNSYHFLIENCDEIVYVSQDYTPSCMRNRNMYLAEKADMLISYVGRSASGAAQTVRMADKLNKKVYNLYPTLDKE